MTKIYRSLTDLIGNTPLLELTNYNRKFAPQATIIAKLEYFNPAGSAKDRIAMAMIDAAEARGLLQKDSVIIEPTSGNTGIGLASVASARGYRTILTMPESMSVERRNLLKAYGAELVLTPGSLGMQGAIDKAEELAAEIPNAFIPGQFVNPANPAIHKATTGPEIWRDTDGKITHFAAGVGTGGTICGTSKFLKEQNPNLISLGLDTYGSVFKKYKETGQFDEGEIYPYLTEGIGEDILPQNVDFSVIDFFEKVTDKDAAIMTRRLAREEGLFVGWSCGTAVHGALEWAKQHLTDDDVMVILLPDHGTRYLAKIYNDTWMKDHGFLEDRAFKTARDIVHNKSGQSQLTTIGVGVSVSQAIQILNRYGISQIPVTDENGHIVGSLTDSTVLNRLIDDPAVKDHPVSEVMDKPFKFVGLDNTIDALSSLIDRDNKALLVRDEREQVHIITQADLLAAMTS